MRKANNESFVKEPKKDFLKTVLQDLHALPEWAQDTTAFFAPASLQL